MRLVSLACCGLLVLSQSGCAMVTSSNNYWRGVWSNLGQTSRNAEDPGTRATGEWDFVGKMARGDQPRESENDPLKKLLFSSKSLEIERSLGIGE